MDKYKDSQMVILEGLESIRKEGGFLERKSALKALQELRSNVFDLSFEDVHEKAWKLEKQLCKDTNNEWDDDANMCKIKEDR